MEVGTIKTIKDANRKGKLESALISTLGSKSGGSNGGGGNNGGGGDSRKNDFEQHSSSSGNKLQISMWFILLIVLMTFGGLVAAYIVLATKKDLEWRPFNLPLQIWISTLLIILSSLSYKVSQNHFFKENQAIAKKWLHITTVLGGLFIISQILAWFALMRSGITVQANPYAGFFYILTGVHAAHVIGGICALGYIVRRTRYETDSDKEMSERKNVSRFVGWYWHFMDALWLFLVVLLGFWK
ncbi:MAG TPA: heme-copper oxidase subunit III [Pyrinomonadaceae bacterium]|nr:heme-copper oxidase subunit III [Pyrinomonadaceae bacterium]